MAAALLMMFLLLTVPLTAFTANVYYVTADDAAGHEQACPPHQICHNLSYYISQPGRYFTSNTTIIFLEGHHSFDREDLVQVNNVHKLTMMGQGEWPVAGAEETVMQSTVIINCTRERGGFIFDTGYDITIEGLTITNCGQSLPADGVLLFANVSNLLFHKNSMQFMVGYGLMVKDCNNVSITNSSYYHSVVCLTDNYSHSGGGVLISYHLHSQDGHSLKISHSNTTKCCSSLYGGGIELLTNPSSTVSLNLVFSSLVFTQNRASSGGGFAARLQGSGKVFLEIQNSLFFNSSADQYGTGAWFEPNTTSSIVIRSTNFIENSNSFSSNFYQNELHVSCLAKSNFSLLDSTITHTKTVSDQAVLIRDCDQVTMANTTLTIANQRYIGVVIEAITGSLIIKGCHFIGSYNLSLVLLVNSKPRYSVIDSCTFSNNTNGHSVIFFYQAKCHVINSNISDNNMTGITVVESDVQFFGLTVIQNNRYTEGAGITLTSQDTITVHGELHMINNSAKIRGGAILVVPHQLSLLAPLKHRATNCTFNFNSIEVNAIYFSGNRAENGGSDIYGAMMIDCNRNMFGHIVNHIGLRNETSRYFSSALIDHFHFSNTDRLSSMSSDPIMVCFCIADRPDCSDRTPRHIQTYPGLEINTSIATVGYYGGTSPGVVQVSAQNAKLVHFYGQNETTSCFQLHILLEKMSSSTALVDIKVEDGLKDWGLSLTVDMLECPIGFITVDQISGQHQCRCVPLLADNHVQCNLTPEPYKFVRSGNSWFAYINNTQCITGTSNCPFDYCNRSNVSFDIMAPDRQCLGNRTGILCGQCQSHLSIMLGSNRCGTCSNWYLFLLPVFGLAGISLVAVLMFLNLSVSVGTINGLLFYANMVKLNEAFFFPNGSIPVVSQFISWLNLDLGIEVCLFDGLDGYWNTWLQFAFPAYLFLLIGCIIVGCRYSVWLCRLCGSHAVPALATLFLMSYTKILLTATNALSMSQLPCNDSILTVWSVDGNIEYGSGNHLILAVFSCGVLVMGLAYPVLVLCAPLLERYSDKCISQQCRWNPAARLKPLLDAYGGPYKDKYRFWTGVTLMVRLIFTVIFSFTLGGLAVINTACIITVIVGILTVWSFTNGVYKSIHLSALEAVYLLNMFLLSTFSLTATSLDSTNYRNATAASICVSVVVFLVTVTVHIRQNFDLKKIKRRLGFKDRPEYILLPQVSADEDDEEVMTPRSGSPPVMVYDSNRWIHQYVLDIRPSPRGNVPELQLEPGSPKLVEREPLLFDTNMSF